MNDNKQPLTPDDPRLTAYALGELDEPERITIAREIKNSTELQALVEQIRTTASLLTVELKAEPAGALSDQSRKAIQEGDTRLIQASRVRYPKLVPAAMAASLLVALTATYYTIPHLYPPQAESLAVDNKDRGLWMRYDPNSVSTENLPGGGGSSVTVLGEVAAGEAIERRVYGFDPAGQRARVDIIEDGEVELGRVTTQPAPDASQVTLLGIEHSTIPHWAADKLEFDADADRISETSGSNPSQPTLAGGTLGSLNDGGVDDQYFAAGVLLYRDSTDFVLSTSEFKAPTGADGANGVAGIATVPIVIVPRNGTDHRDPNSALFGLPYVEGKWETREPSPTTGAEAYDAVVENPFQNPVSAPLSTFSIDVDTASYANLRRFLNNGVLPPPGAVRIEEAINYFEYDYPQPTGEHPFSVNVEVAGCPWAPDHRLAMIGLKGYEVDDSERPPANLVFLIDVSGSMGHRNKLPLVRQSLGMLVDELSGDDYISIVVYAGNSGLVLPPTSCADDAVILEALERLSAGGSTNGGEGIDLAYATAEENFIDGGINRVILATDGDFNVGITNQGQLISLIEDKAQSGVFLSVLGFGMGNYKDATLEKLADKGNGNYAYIDNIDEAEKVLVKQMGGTLMTIAKDVKIQVDFNPAQVSAYRLIGYENRMLKARDFNDDTKDAGEIGAGHTVTALYEIVPAGIKAPDDNVDESRYQKQPTEDVELIESDELLTVKLRYKEPDGDVSKLLEVPVIDAGVPFEVSSDDFALASSVAAFGMLLRGSAHCGDIEYHDVRAIADGALGEDLEGYREELRGLIDTAIHLKSLVERAQP